MKGNIIGKSGLELKELKDKELVAELQNGNDAVFSEIVDRYTEKAHNLAMRITRNAEDTEEILQDVFVTVYRKIGDFQGKSAFSSWLYRITVNTSFMKLRKRKQNSCVALDDITPGTEHNAVAAECEHWDADSASSRHELREALESAISKLPEEYRVIFILRDVDGLSNQEVGKILDLTVPAVKSRLHRSRIMLRKKLQRFYDDYNSEETILYGPKNPSFSFESLEQTFLKAA